MILAGDIGGTHARFALVDPKTSKRVRTGALESRTFTSLEQAVKAFLGPRPPRVTRATLGVAGPVVDNRCTATNLPWVVDGKALARKCGIGRVALINDLVALSFGALTVGRGKLKLLNGAAAPKKSGANLAVIAAGTGLGEAALVWDPASRNHVPLGTEGGHCDFAARDDLEVELLHFLKHRFGRVSYERILSGPGIGNLYDFFVDARGVKETAANKARLAAAGDRNAEISNMAVAGQSKPAARAIALFASLYGAEAGNLALKTLAIGGVFVAGGIAGALFPFLEASFQKSFVSKGRFTPLLEKIPVAVVTDSTIGLAGSAYHAQHID